MSNKKDMIIHLITGLIKKAIENKYIKRSILSETI